MTLEDVANQLLLPILGDIDPLAIQLSIKEEAVKMELRKRLSGGNAKLSNWIGAFMKASTIARRDAFIVFSPCRFVFGSHPYYAAKLVNFQLAIKIFARVSLPLTTLFSDHLYV